MSTEVDMRIRSALGTSPEQVSFRAARFFTMPEPIRVVVRGDPARNVPDHVVDELDDDGQPKMLEVEWVEYEIDRAGTKSTCEARVKDILNVDLTAAADDYAANCAKARAHALLAERERLVGGRESALPDGHMPIEQWGINPHFIRVLKANGIHSVQQMRDVTEAKLSALPGGLQAHRLRDEARAMLLREQDGMMSQRLAEHAKEKAEMQDRIGRLEGMLEDLLDKLGGADQSRRGGRRRAAEVDEQQPASAA